MGSAAARVRAVPVLPAVPLLDLPGGLTALTTGDLAAVQGLSAAAVSQQATALREAGLIATFRNAQTVHHHPTRLGRDLLSASDDARD
ncbi:helix-turn-helix domain-containing protein [Streptomyces sp. NPDC006733]|uniref:helix-turn-helix domain-containing protein n=1 Tax=Streptomyces sp. NPDC006733 TaxID=3155460 RepID=UPI0033C36992